ncbi:hypothetical protein G5714_014176 [Onychostoma macrolepis]|uniref:Uncharacterized protein n=1 Tax=Onychostoma macrolepis TaxID=369639 RepID=A0A7J6CDY0_9TELE|nr:hypothetical protein G5714_014176 [Onychostoma macrolepis]
MGGILAREGHLGMRYRELRRISISKPSSVSMQKLTCLIVANKPARERTGRHMARDEDGAAQSDYRSPTLRCG